jgi:hypothetical protein
VAARLAEGPLRGILLRLSAGNSDPELAEVQASDASKSAVYDNGEKVLPL